MDPWSGGGFLPGYAPKDAESRGLYYLYMPNGYFFFVIEKLYTIGFRHVFTHFFSSPILCLRAHHLDLRGPHPEDPSDVVATREIEEKVMWGWILEHVRRGSIVAK